MEADITQSQAHTGNDNTSPLASLAEAGRALQSQDNQLTDLLETTERLRSNVQKLVEKLRRQALEQASGKAARTLRREISLNLAALESVEVALSSQMRRLGKGLAKADAKLSEVAEGDVEAITRGLRKARKKIDDALD